MLCSPLVGACRVLRGVWPRVPSCWPVWSPGPMQPQPWLTLDCPLPQGQPMQPTIPNCLKHKVNQPFDFSPAFPFVCSCVCLCLGFFPQGEELLQVSAERAEQSRATRVSEQCRQTVCCSLCGAFLRCILTCILRCMMQRQDIIACRQQ